MRLIDASNPETYPPEMEKIVLEHIAAIRTDTLNRIRSCHIDNTTDVRCALENYLGTSTNIGFHMYRNELIPAFNRYEILCYHATRIESTVSILNKGIISDMEEYERLLAAFLEHEGVEEGRIHVALEAIRHEYYRKYRNNPHQICFFINPSSLYNEDGSAAYDQFYETVGGELANWALAEKCPDVLSVLQKKGVPVVVAFKTPFTKVADYHQDVLISPFVYSVAAKHIWGFDCPVEADSSLIGNVPPEDIIDVSVIGEERWVVNRC